MKTPALALAIIALASACDAGNVKECPGMSQCTCDADGGACNPSRDGGVCPLLSCDVGTCVLSTDVGTSCPPLDAGSFPWQPVDAGSAPRVDRFFTFGASGSDQVSAVAGGPSGETLLAGQFSQTVSFDPDSPGQTHTAPACAEGSLQSCGLFVSQWSAAGRLQWTTAYRGSAVGGLAVGSDGRVFVSVSRPSASGASEYGIVELGADGALASERFFGPGVWLGALATAGDDLLVAGNLRGTCDLDPGPGVDERTATTAAFVSRLGPLGEYRGSSIWGGPLVPPALASDESGATYVAGAFEGTIDLDPDGEGADVHSSGSTSTMHLPAAFLLKLGTAGQYLWGRSFATGTSMVLIAAVRSRAGRVWVAGMAGGRADYAPGDAIDRLPEEAEAPYVTSASFLSSFDDAGARRWTRTFGYPYAQFGASSAAASIAVDAEGGSLVAGVFSGLAVFRPTPETVLHATSKAQGGQEAFLIRFGPEGQYRWSRTAGADTSTSVAGALLHQDGRIVVSGAMMGALHWFDPSSWFGEGVQPAQATITGHQPDGFILRMR
ncbi:MAG: hypothetical protein HY901_05300 [Deltaproteobacteria bacterium]|nr:hypothetical protein [Deltaproteobacteria bacterium]